MTAEMPTQTTRAMLNSMAPVHLALSTFRAKFAQRDNSRHERQISLASAPNQCNCTLNSLEHERLSVGMLHTEAC